MGGNGYVHSNTQDDDLLLPPITPIQTNPIRKILREDSPVTTIAVVEKVLDEECVTPKSKEHQLQPLLICPPAPRKKLKRKAYLGPPPSTGFFNICCDLNTVFLDLENRQDVKKRIKLNLLKRVINP